MNRVWAVLTFGFCFMLVKKEFKFDKKLLNKQLIYCANHTSYMDIPMLFLTIPGYFSIIGKAELGRIPLFGKIFRKVYVAVDRRSGNSRKDAFDESYRVLDQGRSMVFYPEGTIPKHGAPKMIAFKDGAFKLAIEKQIPVVPITFPYNWIILPENLKTLLTPRWSKMIFHEPISTEGMTLKDLPELKQRVYNIIDTEIRKYYDYDN